MSLGGNQDRSIEESKKTCPVCESSKLVIFFTMPNMPVFSNIIISKKEDAINCQKKDIKLAFCKKCGYVTNVAFDPQIVNYDQVVYENPLDYSKRYQEYSLALAKDLIERYNLRRKDIISLGCGNGNFLYILCKQGNNTGTGFDPSCVNRFSFCDDSQIRFVKDRFSEKYAEMPMDIIVCNHTLEHVPNPKEFLLELNNLVKNKANIGVFFEVPNALSILKRAFCWDIIYEHKSYFTPQSIERLFLLSKFKVHKFAETFGRQFIIIHAKPNPKEVLKLNNLNTESIQNYINSVNLWKNKINRFSKIINKIKVKGERCIVWGGGSKAVTFLNTFNDSSILYAIDLNPNKHGNYIAGTAQQIMPPKFLSTYKPDSVIIMNPIYKSEIQTIINKIGISSRIICA